MDPALRRLIEYLKLRNLSPQTIESYSGSVTRYSEYCYRHGKTRGSSGAVRAYLLHLKEERDLAPSTINVYYSALKMYFTHGRAGKWDLETLPRQRRPRKLPVVLTKQQVRAVFDATRRTRYRVALMLAYSGGLRRSEVTHLRVADIDSKRMRILVSTAKGGKQRYVMLSNQLLAHLRAYWQLERPRTWLFPSRKNKQLPMCPDTLSRAFRISRDRAGLPKGCKLHCLRHSFATHLLESRVPLPHIQRLLGHTSLQTTLVYLKVANPEFDVVSPFDHLGYADACLPDL